MAQTNSTKGIVFQGSSTYTQLLLFSVVDVVSETDLQEFSNPQSSDIVGALRNTQRNQTVVNVTFLTNRHKELTTFLVLFRNSLTAVSTRASGLYAVGRARKEF